MARQSDETLSGTSPRPEARSLVLRLSGLPKEVFSALVDPARQQRAVLAVLVAYVVVWTLYGLVAKAAQDIHPDTAELFTWSKSPALGYWKHPPFGVYVVKAWSIVFPIDDWSFYLLGIINAAVALWIAWRLSSSLLDNEKRAIGLALLTLVPFYNLFALNYNHNTLLIPLWAATTLFFLKSFETCSVRWAALAGLAAGVAMLGKYWSAVLLAGLGLAALTDPRRRTYFRSNAPWVTILVGSVVIGPHLVWLHQNHWVSLVYAMRAHKTSIASVAASGFDYVLASILYAIVPIAVIAIAVRPSIAVVRDTLLPSSLNSRLVAVAFWAPILLAVTAALLGSSRLISLWAIPAMTLLPTVMLSSPLLEFRTETSIKIIGLAMILPLAALLLLAPVAGLSAFLKPNANGSCCYQLLADAAQRIWREHTDRPLKFVMGDVDAAVGVSFYSPDHPIANPMDTVAKRLDAGFPLIDMGAEEVRRSGALVVCRGGARECSPVLHILSSSISPERIMEVKLSRHFLGWLGKPATFSLVVMPPAE
jgi:4-amino-4-deoxy-L-arabinose transferase-like glycosyltransferase